MKGYLTVKQEILLRTIAITLIVYVVFKYFIPLFLPFLIAFLLAVMIRPVVRFLHRMFHIPMGLGAGIILVGAAAVIGIGGVWLGRAAAGQLVRLGQKLPDIWASVCQWVWDRCGQVERTLKMQEGTLMMEVTHWLERFVQTGGKGESAPGMDQMWGLVETSLQGATGFLRSVVSLLVTVFVTIGATLITTSQMEQLRQAMDRSLFGREIRCVSSILGRVGIAYGKTQLVIVVCTVIISGVGLTILGDPYALLWAGIIGLVDALPLFGAGTILWPWLALSLFRGQWIRAVGLAVIYVVSNLTRQWMEARYMGERIGISPLENLIAMYVGLRWFGILGLFLGPMGYLLIKESGREGTERGIK